MKFPRLFPFGLASLLALGTAHAEPPTVHLYNWSDFLAPDTAKELQAATGIKLVQDVFDDAEVMESKLMAGRSGYDVVIIPDDLIPNFAKAGVLQELDRSQLGNWPHLDAEVLHKLQVNDPGNRYAVPYMWGTTGIGYNADKVAQRLGPDAPVDSWDLIFKKENISKLSECGVAMLDAPVEIIPITLHYLGLPPNSKTPADYERAEALLRSIRPLHSLLRLIEFPLRPGQRRHLRRGRLGRLGIQRQTDRRTGPQRHEDHLQHPPRRRPGMDGKPGAAQGRATPTARLRLHRLHAAPGNYREELQLRRLPQRQQGRHQTDRHPTARKPGRPGGCQ